MMLIISASRAQIEYMVLRTLNDRIASLPSTTSELIYAVLSRLRDLFALSTIINPRSTDALSFLETSDSRPRNSTPFVPTSMSCLKNSCQMLSH